MMRVPWFVAWPVILAVTAGALYYFANRAVYFPTRYPEGMWREQASLGADDVWLEAERGVRLHGWMMRRADSSIATLFLHGNAGNVTHRGGSARQIVAAGSSVLLLDYRGYGKSGGSPSEAGLYADARAAYEWLTRHGYAPARIIVHGESLGTAVAVRLASERPCAGVVLEAPFPSAHEMAGRVWPVLGPLLIHSFDSLARIGRVRAPLLFIHGDRDQVVPYRMGQELFAAAPEPKAFWTVPGAGHNDIVETAAAAYPQRLAAFYASLPR
jgi:fermentation-respiration switch protein FrsA (DUF1100 family)